MRAILSLLLFAFPFTVGAHSGGHGSAIEGVGPGGGKLAPVVLASEAELGAKAKTRAVAEWKRDGEHLAITLVDAVKRRPVKLAAGAELKWILIGKRLAKPLVIKQSLPGATASFHERFPAPILDQVDAIEVILPGLSGSKVKHVLSFEL